MICVVRRNAYHQIMSMNLFSKPTMVVLFACIGLCCAPKPFTAVMVRPASCSHDLQFAECANLGYLLEFADKMHKPIFLNFYAPWVENCTKMDQYVYTQDELASYFNTNFINYKINVGGASPGPELTDRFGVTVFPTLMFVDGKGKIMKKHEGPMSAAALLEMGYFLHDAVEKEMVSIGSGE